MLAQPRYENTDRDGNIKIQSHIGTKTKRQKSKTKVVKTNEEFDNFDPVLSDDESNKRIDQSLQNKHLDTEENNQEYRILEPFRSLGIVIDNNPFCYYKRANDRFLVASNNNSFLLYNCERLNLERISPPLPKKINALAVYKNIIFTASENIILSWSKIHIVNEYLGHKAKIIQLLTFEKLLLSLDETGTLICFDIYTKKIVKQIQLNAKMIYHPATYLNKLLYTDGFHLYLYNIKSETLIYKFENLRKEGDGEITILEQSPVIDIVALGFSSGNIKIINMRTDKIVQEFNMKSRITGLTFSSTIKLNISLLASTDMSGDIVFWDLNSKQKHFVLKAPHNEKIVTNLKFLPNEPILVTSSGEGNSIVMWQFEKESTVPKLLKQRTGHYINPHLIRFYGDEDKQLLSISKDGSLRKISLYNEQQNCEFSKVLFI
jgi:U3 small nucleolar RNA-associated protein 21